MAWASPALAFVLVVSLAHFNKMQIRLVKFFILRLNEPFFSPHPFLEEMGYVACSLDVSILARQKSGGLLLLLRLALNEGFFLVG